MSKFLKDLTSVGASKVAIIIFGLLKAVAIARWLGPETNGIIAALNVYPAMFMAIGSLGIRQSTTYFVGKGEYSLDQIKIALTQIWFFTSIFSLICCFYLIVTFSKASEDLGLILLAILPIPFSLFITYNSGIFLGQNNIKVFSRINWIPPFVVFVATVFLIILFPLGIIGAMTAAIFGPLVMAIILLMKNDFLSSFSLKFDFKIIKSLLSLGLIYAFALLVINLNYKIDVILLDNLSTSYELGIYSKGAQLMEYLWQIPMLLSTIIFARSVNAKDGLVFSRKVAHLLRMSLIVVGLGSLFLFLFSRWIIVMLFGVAFEESYIVQQLLLPGVLLLTIFKVLNMDLAGKGKPWIALYSMIPALLINIGLNIYLIPTYGAKGAAFASTISYTVAALLFIVVYSKTVGIKVGEILRYSKEDFFFLNKIFASIKIKS